MNTKTTIQLSAELAESIRQYAREHGLAMDSAILEVLTWYFLHSQNQAIVDSFQVRDCYVNRR